MYGYIGNVEGFPTDTRMHVNRKNETMKQKKVRWEERVWKQVKRTRKKKSRWPNCSSRLPNSGWLRPEAVEKLYYLTNVRL